VKEEGSGFRCSNAQIQRSGWFERMEEGEGQRGTGEVHGSYRELSTAFRESWEPHCLTYDISLAGVRLASLCPHLANFLL
jgi:hypothetical protein